MKISTLKAAFIISISSFIGIMSSPDVLMASDSVDVIGLDSAGIVETVEVKSAEIVETIQEVEVQKIEIAQKIEPVQRTEAPKPVVSVAKVEEPVVVSRVDPNNNVKFSWGEQELMQVSSTAVNSGENVARVGKLIWGHNYTSFGNITKLKIGDTFTLTENGITTTYKVAANPINGAAGVVLDKKNDTKLSYAGSEEYDEIGMNAFIKYGLGHSLTLLTCYGQNSRYIVVADAI